MAAASNSQIQLMWQRRKILSDIRLFWKVTLPLIPFFTQPLFMTLCALFTFQKETAIFIEKYCTVNPEKSKIETYLQFWKTYGSIFWFSWLTISIFFVESLQWLYLCTHIWGRYIYLLFEIYVIVYSFLGRTWPTS